MESLGWKALDMFSGKPYARFRARHSLDLQIELAVLQRFCLTAIRQILIIEIL